MAQKYTTMMISDLDGTTGTEDEIRPVEFGIDGKYYEIDLTKPQADELRERLSSFIAAARLAPTTTPASPQARRTALANERAADAKVRAARKEQNDEIRAWAQKMGIPVSSRRIATDTANAYHKWLAEQQRRTQTPTPLTEQTERPAVAQPHFQAP